MDTQTQIDRLIELAIVQRTDLKKLVSELPQLREHLSAEIERTFDEFEPQLRTELEEFCATRADDKHAKLSAELGAKIESFSRALQDSAQAKFSALLKEREENVRVAKEAESKIAEHAASLPSAVKEIVDAELSRFPRAGEIDQLRKEFQEPRGLNPRGKWQSGEVYNKLDLVAYNGDSFVSNTNGNRERPNRASEEWTLNAARGNSGGGGGIASLTDILPIPSSGQILGSEGPNYTPKTLVAGANITITETPTQITITGDEGQIELQDGTAAAPSLFFVNDVDTGLFRPGTNLLGIAAGGQAAITIGATEMTLNVTDVQIGGNLSIDNDTLFIDKANSRVGIGTSTPEASLVVRSQGSTNSRSILVEHNDNTTAFSQAKFIGARSRGSHGSPSAVLANDSLASFNGRGYKASEWSNTVGGFYVYAAENWTNTATGSFAAFRLAATGGTTVSEVARLTSTGNLLVGGTTDISGAGGLKVFGTTSASTSLTGSLLIGNASAATNVGIGGGNINAGGTITSGGNLTVSGGTIGTAASTNLTLAGGSSGASLFLGHGTNGVSSITARGTATIQLANTDAPNGVLKNVATLYGGSDATLGPVLLYFQTFPSATGSERYAALQSADGGNNRRLVLCPSGANVLIGGTTDITGSGGLKVFGTTASTSTTTGALQVAGGVGVAGALFTGGKIESTSTAALTFGLSHQGGWTTGGKVYSGFNAGIFSGTASQSAVFGWVYDPTTPSNSFAHITPTGTAEGAIFKLTTGGNLLIGGTTDITGSGGLKVFGTTASTSTTTGALQVAGGVGVAGAAFVGGAVNVLGSGLLNFRLGLGGAGTMGTITAFEPLFGNAAGSAFIALQRTASASDGEISFGTTNTASAAPTQKMRLFRTGGLYLGTGTVTDPGVGCLNLAGTTASTSTTTGALTVAGGVGVAGALFAGGNVTVNGTDKNILLNGASTAFTRVADIRVAGDTEGRLLLRGGGSLIWGNGSGTFDSTLERTSANLLTITGALTTTGAIAIGNTVNTVSPTSPDRTITIVVGGTTYYIHAKTTND
jgi:hypothetical protein